MPRLLLISFVFFWISATGQKSLVEGYAFNSSQTDSWVSVTVNDTIHKALSKDPLPARSDYEKLYNDSNFRVTAKSDGRFKILAQQSDTLVFTSFRHISKRIAVADLLLSKPIEIRLDREPCENYVECHDSSPTLIVFVGRKIKVTRSLGKYYCNVVSLDSKYEAIYEIVKPVLGEYKSDTIKFSIYDHYGIPAFSKTDTVLLFVTRYCDELIHEKYTFNYVFKAVNQNWAAPYHPSKDSAYNKLVERFIEPMTFSAELGQRITETRNPYFHQGFPTKYFKLSKGWQIPLYGINLENLIEFNKEIMLKDKSYLFK